jgi:hypothetical protein
MHRQRPAALLGAGSATDPCTTMTGAAAQVLDAGDLHDGDHAGGRVSTSWTGRLLMHTLAASVTPDVLDSCQFFTPSHTSHPPAEYASPAPREVSAPPPATP